MSYNTTDAMKQEFNKYLALHNVQSELSRVLGMLFQEPERPADPIEYIRRHLGQDSVDMPSGTELLEAKIRELRRQLRASEAGEDVGNMDRAAPDDLEGPGFAVVEAADRKQRSVLEDVLTSYIQLAKDVERDANLSQELTESRAKLEDAIGNCDNPFLLQALLRGTRPLLYSSELDHTTKPATDVHILTTEGGHAFRLITTRLAKILPNDQAAAKEFMLSGFQFCKELHARLGEEGVVPPREELSDPLLPADPTELFKLYASELHELQKTFTEKLDALSQNPAVPLCTELHAKLEEPGEEDPKTKKGKK